VSYSYDVPNPKIEGLTHYAKGRRTRVDVAGGTSSGVDSFDPLGRVTRTWQETNGTKYRFGSDGDEGYVYWRNGAVASMRLPTGRLLIYSYDDDGMATALTDGVTMYVSGVTYADHGGVETMRTNGWRMRETRSYDADRLQLTGIAVAQCTDNSQLCTTPAGIRTFGYTYQTSGTAGNGSGPDNNGSLRRQDITDAGIATVQRQAYSYDALDRLTGFTEGPVGGSTVLNESYCYDGHGNRAVLQRVGLSPLIPQVTSCTASAVSAMFPGNRWATMTYDAGGGIGNDGRSNLRYNGEDQLVKTWPAVGAATETVYGYDGDGKRVTMAVGAGAPTVFVYDGFGKLAVEYGAVGAVPGREFVSEDHLGSTRLVTNGEGGVVRRMDYWPFGMEIGTADTAVRTAGLGFVMDGRMRVKFTGQGRDEGTGLDYFGARYMSGAMGRFVSADAPFADQFVENPQSWNRYSYVRNNPLNAVDLDGRDRRVVSSVLCKRSE